jgi:SsrA-binding protein
LAIKIIATNRKARHEYHFDDTYEAGLVLMGSEIKSIRAGRVSLQNHEPRRRRKLLLHRRQIDRLHGRTREKGYTVIPTKLYLKDGRAKVEIALARGKRQYDKRQTIAKRDSKRQVERAIKERHR